MAIIDPNIALAYRPPQFENPLNVAAQQSTLQSMANQQALQQQALQMGPLQQQAVQQENTLRQRAIQDDLGFRQLYSQALSNPNAALPSDASIFATLGPTAGAAWLNTQQALLKSRADTSHTNAQTSELESQFAAGLAAGMKANKFSPQSVQWALGQAVRANYPKEAQMLANVASSPTAAQDLPALAEQLLAGSKDWQSIANQQAEADLNRAKLPGVQAEAFDASQRAYAGYLASQAGSPESYQAALGQLPAEWQKVFADPYDAKLTRGALQYRAMTAEQQRATDQKAQEIAKQLTEPELAMKAAGNGPDAAAANRALQILAKTKRDSQVQIVLTPAGQSVLNNQIAGGGTPSLPGRAGAIAIGEAYNQIGAQTNGTADLNSAKATYKADAGSLAALTANMDQVTAFEKTAQANLQRFLELTKHLPDTGMPWLNSPVRMLNEKVVGNEWAPAINAAQLVANTEIAKVTSNPGISGQLTEGARHEVESVNPRDATIPQLKHIAETLINDMQSRHQSLDGQIKTIRARMAQANSQSGYAVTAPDGSTYYFPSQGQADQFKKNAGIQ